MVAERAALLITYVVVMALLVFLVRKMVNHSYAQDEDGDTEHTWRQQGMAGPFLIVFSLGYSALSVDFVMSLQPTWFSTMWGVYMFAGHWQAACALVCLVAVWLIETDRISTTWLNENHVHDAAKFTFAFTVFYAYIAFSQFLLIWYANLPEEATFFVYRAKDGWLAHSLWIPAAKFIIPFAILLRHGIKRLGKGLKFICMWIITFQAYEMWWIVAPAAKHGSAHPGPGIPFVEWTMILGFFARSCSWQAKRSLRTTSSRSKIRGCTSACTTKSKGALMRVLTLGLIVLSAPALAAETGTDAAAGKRSGELRRMQHLLKRHLRRPRRVLLQRLHRRPRAR